MTDDEKFSLHIAVARCLGARAEYHDGTAPELPGVPNRHRTGWAIYMGGERVTFPRNTEKEAWEVIAVHGEYTTDPARILEVQAAVIERFGAFVLMDERDGRFRCRILNDPCFGSSIGEALCVALVDAMTPKPIRLKGSLDAVVAAESAPTGPGDPVVRGLDEGKGDL